MNKAYNEPEFRVIVSKSEDVITTSGEAVNPVYNNGPFETEDVPFVTV
ncbi:MAG: hypothetical protein IJR70_03100 [Eubacterium sp.]|nr:hypothetical protein [Eubacterium sp.]